MRWDVARDGFPSGVLDALTSVPLTCKFGAASTPYATRNRRLTHSNGPLNGCRAAGTEPGWCSNVDRTSDGTGPPPTRPALLPWLFCLGRSRRKDPIRGTGRALRFATADRHRRSRQGRPRCKHDRSTQRAAPCLGSPPDSTRTDAPRRAGGDCPGVRSGQSPERASRRGAHAPRMPNLRGSCPSCVGRGSESGSASCQVSPDPSRSGASWRGIAELRICRCRRWPWIGSSRRGSTSCPLNVEPVDPLQRAERTTHKLARLH
jgi:hypothetical protein